MEQGYKFRIYPNKINRCSQYQVCFVPNNPVTLVVGGSDNIYCRRLTFYKNIGDNI